MQTPLTPQIKELLAAVPDSPAISMIIPMETIGASPIVTLQHKLKVLADQLGHELKAKYAEEACKAVMDRLSSVIATLHIEKHKKGIAIFVSPDFGKVVLLDTFVREKVVVNSSFEIRDLLQDKRQADKYLVLLLSCRQRRLYQGSTAEFLKIIDGVPQVLTGDDVDREQGANPVATESGKETLMDHFLHQVDREIGQLIARDHLPVFVMGAKRVLGHFKKITRNRAGIATYISGNYDRLGFAQLQKLLEPYLVGLRTGHQEKLLALLDRAADQKKLIVGITQVKEAALNKRGQKLVVENNFVYPVHPFLTASGLGAAQDQQTFFFLPDAVEDVIANVIANGGDVDFTDNYSLDKYEHIALVTY